MGAAVSTGQGWGGGRKGAGAMTGVSPQWWRSTAALRTEGWRRAPGCSPDLFPGSAQLHSRHGLPQHASKGSFPAPQPSCLLLLPLSLPSLCFLQQLRGESTQNRVTQEGGCLASLWHTLGNGKLGSGLLSSSPELGIVTLG